MPQAAVRIAPSSPAADFARLGEGAGVVARADVIGLHPGAGPRLRRGLRTVRRPGKRAGVAPDPAMPAAAAENAPDPRDLVPVMSVTPRFGRRSFLESQLPKIDEAGRDTAPEVDGGVPPGTAPRRAAAALRGSA